ncbi:MAG: DUF5690 family protein [Cellvibrionales bacterium]|nr:DUF5690 family protein [Cellvibrionales bacterium]
MPLIGNTKQKIQSRLAQTHSAVMIIFVGCAAMMTYFSMYAFRKPFSAATYSDVDQLIFSLDYKTLLVITQVIGYALSKFIGIKLIAEMPAHKRIQTLLAMMGIAQLALVSFALIPTPWNIIAIFFNGLPLGFIWGLVFAFLEGRRVSEALGVILGVSLIFSSGVVKSLGRYLLLEWQIPDLWMPATMGFLFLPLLFIAVFALSCAPPPNHEDQAHRQTRITMNLSERLHFFGRYWFGLLLLVASYVIFTSLREFIDNFSPEIFTGLGFESSSIVYTSTILPVTFVVMGLMLGLMFIKNNLIALHLNSTLALFGFMTIALSTLAFQFGYLSGLGWMTLLQMGIYAGFMPFNCLLFDRLIAATPTLGNAGFLMYIADSSGYLGSVLIMLYRATASTQLDWVDFVADMSVVSSFMGMAFLLMSMSYFHWVLASQGRTITSRA